MRALLPRDLGLENLDLNSNPKVSSSCNLLNLESTLPILSYQSLVRMWNARGSSPKRTGISFSGSENRTRNSILSCSLCALTTLSEKGQRPATRTGPIKTTFNGSTGNISGMNSSISVKVNSEHMKYAIDDGTSA